MIVGKRARSNVTSLVAKLRSLADAHTALTHYPNCTCPVCQRHRTGYMGTVEAASAAYKIADVLQGYATELEQELR